MAPKQDFLDFLKNFVFFKTTLSLIFPGNNLKWRLILLLILHYESHIRQYSDYGPKCCWPIKLQDYLKCNISKKKWMMTFIFCMQINIKVFCKLMLSFWVCLKKEFCISLQYFQINIEDEFDFLPADKDKSILKVVSTTLGIQSQVCSNTQNHKFAMQYCKENVKDEANVWPADKHQRFQIDSVIFIVFGQVCPNYPLVIDWLIDW